MTRFFWVRHAPTHARTMVGWSDLPADLSDKERFARLDAHLPGEALVVSSDLTRAVATADLLSKSRTRLPHDPSLREINFGAWELQPFDSIEDQQRLRAFWDDPGDVRPPGGESWREVTGRVGAAVDRLTADHPGRDIVIVAHLGPIVSQVEQALRLSSVEAFAYRIDNLSVTELQWTGETWQAGNINHHP